MHKHEYLHRLLNHLRKAYAMLDRCDSIGDKILQAQLKLYIEYREEDEQDLLLQQKDLRSLLK